MEGYGHRTEVVDSSGVTGDGADACAKSCTDFGDTVHGNGENGSGTDNTEALNPIGSHPAADGSEAPADESNPTGPREHGPTATHFAEALTMIARLPLSDAEKADAVRRLLANPG
ncbi:MAG: hypothetical protein HOP29_10465 [Phycisphaerales bacterium]|nr:hypothetical protein [Phycisphaerales bacterium]